MGMSLSAQTRPAIVGVSHIAVYTSDAAKTEHFYVHDIGLKKGEDPENSAGVRYYVNQEQFVEVLPLPAGRGGEPAGSSGVHDEERRGRCARI